VDADQEYAFLVSDNAIALWAELDLSSIHKDLPELGLGDLDLLGIRGFELEPDPETADPDAIPAPPDVPKSKLGDLWLLGPHRLLVGDATKEEDVGRLMAGEQADLVFTDPPYNVNYEGSDGQKIQNDDMDNADFLVFLLAAFKNYFGAMKEGASIYVFHADTEGGNFRTAFKSAGLKLSSCIIWNKSSLIMGRSDYHWKHEPCLYGWKPGAGHKWYSDRTQTTVYDHDKGSGEDNKNHPTSKPVSLVEYFMGNSSKKGDLVLDLFLGGGSTLIAAEQSGRRCFGTELDPKYADVILQRYRDFSGKDPIREDGVAWSQL
jgi:site-specific DNA-methyltransferase (adenine-specific)